MRALFIRFFYKASGVPAPTEDWNLTEPETDLSEFQRVTCRANCPGFSEDIDPYLSLSDQNRTDYIPLTSASLFCLSRGHAQSRPLRVPPFASNSLGN
jgi:hypothetical protein